MNGIMLFFLKSICISGVMYGYYSLVLKNKTHHAFNRFFLLSIFPAGILIPFFHFAIYQLPIKYLADGYRQSTGYARPVEIGFMAVSINSYLLVCGCLLTFFFKKIRQIFLLKKSGESKNINGVVFIVTENSAAPFSFFNNLFWKKGMDVDSDPGKQIIAHEMSHIHQKHSYDRFISQYLCCLFWINPFFWFAQKELGIVHEFLADENSFQRGDSFSFATMLLSTYAGGQFLTPDLGFNRSNIQRRLAMISMHQKKHRLWKLCTPALAFMILLTGLVNGKYETKINNATTPYQIRKLTQQEQKLNDEKNSLILTPKPGI